MKSPKKSQKIGKLLFKEFSLAQKSIQKLNDSTDL